MARLMMAGVCLGVVVCPAVNAADWPMWRHDGQRSAAAIDTELPQQLHVHWTRKYDAPRAAWEEDVRLQFDASYEPIVVGQTMLLASAQTDSVTAIDTRTGDEQWRVYADGPVRFAPVAHDGRAYFGADDGCFYCVEVASGRVVWKFNAAPNGRMVLGNERLISVWPVRGGPVLHRGKVWFVAGVWPFEGALLYSFEAARSDETPTMDVATLPTKLLPQGPLSANKNGIYIPTGRGTAYKFDPVSREFSVLRYSARGTTDYHVTLGGKWLFHGTRIYDTDHDHSTKISMDRPVCAGTVCYGRHSKKSITAFDLSKLKWTGEVDEQGCAVMEQAATADWVVRGEDILGAAGYQRREGTEPIVSMRAGDRVYGYWDRLLFALDIPENSSVGSIAWTHVLPDTPTSMIAADERLFVASDEGRLYCFGGEKRKRQTHEPPRFALDTTPLAQRVKALLERAGARAGYAVVLGGTNRDLIDELLRQTDLRLVVVEGDAAVARRLRDRYADSGLHGVRLAVCCGDLTTIDLPPYLASLVVSADLDTAPESIAADGDRIVSLANALRPYGGAAILPLSDEDHARLPADLHGFDVQRANGLTSIVRAGALPGSADWTDEYSTPANTLASKDELVRAPLGLLWYGGPASHPDLFYNRHDWSPGLAVKDGRMFIEGPQRLTAVDVYTGRILWQIPLPEGLSAGRRANWNATGFHLTLASDALYLTLEKECVLHDPATGEQIARLTLPDPGDFFGRVRLHGDKMIVPVHRETDDYGKVPVKLVAMDRHNGNVVWERGSGHSFPFVAIGNERVFAFEGLLEDLYDNEKREGRVPKSSETRILLALDARSGEVLWSKQTDRVVTWLAYSDETDVLVASDKMGVEAWDGTQGERLWDKQSEGVGFLGHPENLWDKVVLWNDWVIDQRGPGSAYELRTGEPALRTNPLTGAPAPWRFTKHGHHCGYAVASEHLLTFRAGSAGFLDIETGGTTHLEGFRSGCRNSLIPANGVLCAPNFADECSCSYPVFTSLALTHLPDAEKWSYSAIRTPSGRIKRVGINLGAPGDRLAEDGTLWLDYPSVGGPSPDVELRLDPPRPRLFRSHAVQLGEGATKWVAASGAEGLRQLSIRLGKDDAKLTRHKVRLYFREPDGKAAGDRVFDVAINGQTRLRGLDLADATQATGGGVLKEITGVMIGAVLELSFTPQRGDAVLCGVEVISDDPPEPVAAKP